MKYSRWCRLMEDLGFAKNKETYDQLVTAYRERHRRYHNEQHIDAVLTTLDKNSELATDAKAIELALWFHDAIYKIFSSTNEIDSANWALKFILQNTRDDNLSQKVHSHILATQHNCVLDNGDEQLIVDIDLAILGASEADYGLFEQSIRQEYKLIPWLVYKRKRAEILKGFLAREHIYSHRNFRDSIEPQARINLTNAIVNLT